MKKTILLTLLCLVCASAYTQEVLFDKKNFKEDKDAFKIAFDHLEAADGFFNAVPYPHYKEALEHTKHKSVSSMVFFILFRLIRYSHFWNSSSLLLEYLNLLL